MTSGYRNLTAKVGVVLGLAVAFAIGTAATADAAQMLRLTQGLFSVTISDQEADLCVGLGCIVDDDSNPAVGAITWIGSLGVFTINVTTGLSKPVLGSAAQPHMDLNSVDTSSLAGGVLVIEHTDTGFTSLGSGFALNVGGTSAGTVAYSARFDDVTNLEFVLGTLIASLGPLGPGAFAASGGGGGAGASPYSLTQVVTVTHAGAGVSSFDAELIPEPASLALFGIGLVGVGVASSRRRRNRTR